MRGSSVRARGPSRFALGLLLFGFCASGVACKTAKQFEDEADAEVYALIDARRRELFESEGAFTIDPIVERLRMRILAGERLDAEPLTLLDCLRIAAENSRTYQDRKQAVYETALDLTLEKWRFAAQPFGGASASTSGTIDDPELDDVAADATLGVQRLLGAGATVLGRIGSSLFRVVRSGASWDVIHDASLSITQPLLRGFGRRIAQEPLTQAERNLIYEVRRFERFRRTFAVDVARRFYDVLRTQDFIRNQERNYRNLTSLRERNEALAQAGRLSEIQVDQARQNEVRSENQLLLLRQNRDGRVDQFMLFLGLPIGTVVQFDQSEIEQLDAESGLLAELNGDVAIELARANRLDYQTTLDVVDDRVRKVYVAENALEAGLAVSASIDPVSVDRKFSASNTPVTLGVDFDLPVNRLPERNAYRSNQIRLQEALRNAEQFGDEIRVEIRDALRTFRTTQESWRIQRRAVELAERRVESARLTLEAGRASTRDLLEAQDDLLEAQNQAIAALIDFSLARLDLYLDMELLTIHEAGIQLEPLSRSLPAEGGARDE